VCKRAALMSYVHNNVCLRQDLKGAVKMHRQKIFNLKQQRAAEKVRSTPSALPAPPPGIRFRTRSVQPTLASLADAGAQKAGEAAERRQRRRPHPRRARGGVSDRHRRGAALVSDSRWLCASLDEQAVNVAVWCLLTGPCS